MKDKFARKAIQKIAEKLGLDHDVDSNDGEIYITGNVSAIQEVGNIKEILGELTKKLGYKISWGTYSASLNTTDCWLEVADAEDITKLKNEFPMLLKHLGLEFVQEGKKLQKVKKGKNGK